MLFDKVAVFTDIHFGYKHNSREHNEDCTNFVQWFVAEAKARGCETCIMMGDWHHHRSSVNVSTLNYTLANLQTLNDSFDQVYIITGNHDLFYREKRDISSLAMGRNYPNITLVDEPLVKDDVAIIPWLVEEEWSGIKNIKSKYMFGHFEIPGFKMNAQIAMPDHGEINKKHFKNQDMVFSGHFHKRQSDGHIHYIGNPFGHNYADAWEFDRGAMFLDWGGQPEFVNYEGGPRYITCRLSDLIDNIDEYLQPNTYAKVTLDTTITYEEANFLRDTCMENYPIREFKLIQERVEEEEIEFSGDITFQTVDQIVSEQLAELDLGDYDRKTLIDIWNEL